MGPVAPASLALLLLPREQASAAMVHANAWVQSRRMLAAAGTEHRVCARQHAHLRQAGYRRARAAIAASSQARGAYHRRSRSFRTGAAECLFAHGVCTQPGLVSAVWRP